MECYRKCIVGVNSDIRFGTVFLIFLGVPGTYNFKHDGWGGVFLFYV